MFFIFRQGLFWVGNQGNHQNFKKLLLPYKCWLIFIRKKQKIFFCPWKSVKIYRAAWVGINFDDYPGFQPKTCTVYMVAMIIHRGWKGIFNYVFFKKFKIDMSIKCLDRPKLVRKSKFYNSKPLLLAIHLVWQKSVPASLDWILGWPMLWRITTIY